MRQVLALSHARKSYDGKLVLNDVTLAFLPGAKIGVVGPNGTGKSTLLRMMAGLELPSNGEVRRMPGYSTGLLPQEPVLDPAKTVLGAVAEGVAGTMVLLELYNKVTARLATDYSDDLLDELGRLQEQLDHRNAWDLDSRLEQAMNALRCPPTEAEVSSLSGGERRRVALCRCCCPSRTCCCWTSRPTTWTPRASRGWNSTWASTPARSWRSPTTGISFENVADWILELDRGHATHMRGTTRLTWRRKPPG